MRFKMEDLFIMAFGSLVILMFVKMLHDLI